MKYPQEMIEQFGSVAAFAEAATIHPQAPQKMNGERRVLDASAVYMWKQRGHVPFMWRPVVDALQRQVERGAA